MRNQTSNSQSSRNVSAEPDFSKLGKSKRLAKQNKDYLELFSIVEKSRQGLIGEQARLKSKPGKESAKLLLRQLDLIFHIVSLPYLILITMEGYAKGYVKGQMSVFKEVFLGVKSNPEITENEFEKVAKETMQRFFALDVSGQLSRPWLFATTLYIWTAYECLAGDLWAASLNHATKLGHRVLNSLSGEDGEHTGLSRRHIDVGLAARHGFDLRKSLGSILKPKFNFSDFDGIQTAYQQAFGTCGALSDQYRKTLKELEEVRHLIVHRGGVADAKFVKVTKMKIKPNKTLSLQLPQVGLYMMSATMGCVSLLHVVDEWFIENK